MTLFIGEAQDMVTVICLLIAYKMPQVSHVFETLELDVRMYATEIEILDSNIKISNAALCVTFIYQYRLTVQYNALPMKWNSQQKI